MSTVQRIDLRIIDPSDELKSRLRKRRRGGREADGEEQKVFVDDGPAYPDDDEAVGGIEAKLIMRLVCDHGEWLALPTARTGGLTAKWQG